MRSNKLGTRRTASAALLLCCALLLSGTSARQKPPIDPISPPQTTQSPAETSQVHPAPAFFVMIDPGHGGDDRGAHLGDKLLEKDVTLALAHRVKAELQDRGIAVRILREGDITLSLDQRAEITNSQHAALYLVLHAGMPGRGVRVYSSAGVSSAIAAPGKFLPWDNAQANYLSRSQSLAKGVAGALAKKNLPVAYLGTPLRPLNNINAPALAVELAPDSSNVQDAMGQKFQNAVASAIASEIVQQRSQWERQP